MLKSKFTCKFSLRVHLKNLHGDSNDGNIGTLNCRGFEAVVEAVEAASAYGANIVPVSRLRFGTDGITTRLRSKAKCP